MKKMFAIGKYILSLVIAFAIFTTSLFTGVSLIVSASSTPICAGSVSELTSTTEYELTLLDSTQANSQSNPYIIANANQMYSLMQSKCTYGGETIDTAGAFFKVADGIRAFYMNGGETLANMTTVAEIKNYFEVTNTSPTKVKGDNTNPFQGYFDGNGLTVYGIYNNTSKFGGLFPYVSGEVTIKNVSVKNSYLNSTYSAAGLVGSCNISTFTPISITVENCEVSNNYIASGYSQAGAAGLFAYLYCSTGTPVVTAQNCIVYGNELVSTRETPKECFAIAGSLNKSGCKFTNCIFLDAFPFRADQSNMRKSATYENVYTDADLSTVTTEYSVEFPEGTIMSIGDATPTGAAGKAAMPLLDWDNIWFANTGYPVLRAFHDITTLDGDIEGCDCGIVGVVPIIDVSNIGEKTLIDTTTEWHYLDNNTDPADGLDTLQSWTTADFDDSAWKTVSGKFGSKAGELANVSNCGTPTVLLNLYKEDSTEVIPTYFFRTTLNLSGVESLSGLEFQIYADDGMVVYINGNVVCDSRNGDYSTKTTNLYYAEMTTAGQSFTMDADELAGILQNGENVIAVEVHNNQSASSDIYFSMDYMTAITVDPNAPTFSSVIMNVGADETQKNLTWYTITSKTSAVQFAPASAMIDGAFPTEYETITATTAKATNKVGYYTNKATLANLSENTDYVYRLVVDGKYSDLYYFTVGSFDDYDFVFVGDPQIITSANATQWDDTLQIIDENFDAEFIVSAGDQIATPDSEEQYNWFINDDLGSNAIATTIGPEHDAKNSQSQGVAYAEHYNLPNESTEYGVTVAGGDYWYIYDNTLFMNINFDAKTTENLAQHEEFIRQTISANPDTTWQVIIIHAPFFATSSHADDSATIQFRTALAPVFAEVGIDLVLSGHEHMYTRSKLMLDSTTVSDDVVTDDYVISPEGVQYICASSSTGSKFYEKAYYENDDYISAENYEKRKSAIHFEVTDTSFAMTSYFLDDMSVFDSFTIYNTENAVHTASDNYYISETTHANICLDCGKTYNSANHTDSNSDSICDVCGWPCGEHIFEGASITLTESIAVNYMIKKNVVDVLGYDNLHINFTFGGKDYTVNEYTENGEYYVFTFDKIAPHLMTDTLYATLHGTKDDTSYTSKTYEYSIKRYCHNILESSTDEDAQLRALLVDLLNYGAEAQTYTNYNTDNLANADLTDAQKAWGTSGDVTTESVQNLKYKVIDNPTVKWKGASLYLDEEATLRFTIQAEKIENLVVKVTCGTTTLEIPSNDFIKRNDVSYDNAYYIYVRGIGVTQMREAVYLTVLSGETEVSNTICYSVESYANAKIGSDDTSLSNLLTCMMKYSDAAKAYADTQ